MTTPPTIPPRRVPAAPSSSPPARTVPPATALAAFTRPTATNGERVCLYGAGGVGKTSLALQAPGPVVFFDLDDSLGKLSRVGAVPEDVLCAPCRTWAELRSTLNAATGWDGIQTIVIDTLTKAEELAMAHVLETVMGPENRRVERVEDFGYGKGYRHFYDEAIKLLSDLERHTAAGRNVILIAHVTATRVPNPSGENWLRYEPLLYQGDKVSFRERICNWVDQLVFLGFDLAVKEGRGTGHGSRAIYTTWAPTHLAKTRGMSPDPILYQKGSRALWDQMFPPATPATTTTPKEG